MQWPMAVWPGKAKTLQGVSRFLCRGALDKKDEIIAHTLRPGVAVKNVVYFPGDIQNMEEEMQSDSSIDFVEYSLERTGTILAQKWQNANIWIFRPTRRVDLSNEYDHLLFAGYGILHLRNCLADAFHKASPTASALPLILVAFSKGGLVLNHLIAEFSTAELLCKSGKEEEVPKVLDWEDESMIKNLPQYEPSQRISRMRSPATSLFELQRYQDITHFFDNIHEMHWVDSHRFPTNPRVVNPWCDYVEKRHIEATQKNESNQDKESNETVTTIPPPLKLFLHGTPRQLNDSRRTFIAKEHQEFISQVIQHHGGMITENALLVIKNYYEGKKGNIQLHFQVLRDLDV